LPNWSGGLGPHSALYLGPHWHMQNSTRSHTGTTKAPFGMQDKKNVGIGKIQELNCHTSPFLRGFKTWELKGVAIWIAGWELHRKIVQFQTLPLLKPACIHHICLHGAIYRTSKLYTTLPFSNQHPRSQNFLTQELRRSGLDARGQDGDVSSRQESKEPYYLSAKSRPWERTKEILVFIRSANRRLWVICLSLLLHSSLVGRRPHAATARQLCAVRLRPHVFELRVHPLLQSPTKSLLHGSAIAYHLCVLGIMVGAKQAS
jgi:hypothetical protein